MQDVLAGPLAQQEAQQCGGNGVKSVFARNPEGHASDSPVAPMNHARSVDNLSGGDLIALPADPTTYNAAISVRRDRRVEPIPECPPNRRPTRLGRRRLEHPLFLR